MSVESVESVETYLALLTRWNASIRLTGSTDPIDLERHVAEARALLPHLPSTGRLVDVGSGGGFPGIIIALALPELSVTLLEPIAKKVSFLNTCRRELALANVTVRRIRDDALIQQAQFEPFDIAVSQATFPPREWFERGRRLVAEHGRVFGMLGPGAEDLPPSLQLIDVELDDRALRIGILQLGTPGSAP